MRKAEKELKKAEQKKIDEDKIIKKGFPKRLTICSNCKKYVPKNNKVIDRPSMMLRFSQMRIVFIIIACFSLCIVSS